MAVTGSVVIGVGNPWRGDDGVGPAVAEVVRRLLDDGNPRDRTPDGVDVAPAAPVDVTVCDGEPTRLLAAWEGADRAVLIDAVVTGAAPGTIHVFRVGRDPLPTGVATSSHGAGVAEAAALGVALGICPAELHVVGVEAASFTEGAGCSPEVSAAVRTAAHTVVGLLDRPVQLR